MAFFNSALSLQSLSIAAPVPWTREDIKYVLRHIDKVGRKFPSAQPRGHSQRSFMLGTSLQGAVGRPVHSSPSEDDVELFLQISNLMHSLEESERHLLWLYAKGLPKEDICRQLGMSRSSVWRRWSMAINKLLIILNSAPTRPKLPRSVR